MLKKIFFTLLISTFSIAAIAQTDDEKTFVSVEQMPDFVGGSAGLNKFIETNLVYPKKEKTDKIEGTVFCEFVVDANGKVTHPKVIRSIKDHPNFDAEVLNLLDKMPNWNPGKQNGKAVPVKFTLPVKFNLKK